MIKRYNILEHRLVDATDEAALVSLYANPDDQELKELQDRVGVDAHTLHSALDPDEVPRVELAPEYVAAIIKRPKSYAPTDMPDDDEEEDDDAGTAVAPVAPKDAAK